MRPALNMLLAILVTIWYMRSVNRLLSMQMERHLPACLLWQVLKMLLPLTLPKKKSHFSGRANRAAHGQTFRVQLLRPMSFPLKARQKPTAASSQVKISRSFPMLSPFILFSLTPTAVHVILQADLSPITAPTAHFLSLPEQAAPLKAGTQLQQAEQKSPLTANILLPLIRRFMHTGRRTYIP